MNCIYTSLLTTCFPTRRAPAFLRTDAALRCDTLFLQRAADDDGKTGFLASSKSTTTNGSSRESSNTKYNYRLASAFAGFSDPVMMEGYVDLYIAQMEALYNYEVPVIRQLQMG